MKKKPLFWVLLVLLAAIVIAGVIWGKQYYDSRYVGKDYYTMVPLSYDMTSVGIKDMSGKEIGTGIAYNLTAYDDQGHAKEVSFRVFDPDSDLSLGEKQPQPGTYLLVNASDQIVLHWKVTEEGSIPAKALEMIR